jgi:hypothetical protein
VKEVKEVRGSAKPQNSSLPFKGRARVGMGSEV